MMDTEMPESDNNYYVTRKKDIVKNFVQIANTARKASEDEVDLTSIEQLVEKARVEFERILPTLPYVGGDKSPFTEMMIQSGETIAFYNACKSAGLETRKIGELLYRIAESQVESISSIKKWVTRRVLFSTQVKNGWRKTMNESQKCKYPGNWVGSYLPREGNSFEFGLDFTECAFLKLADIFGSREIAPYVCLCDFARMRGIGVGFKRTKTLALGHEKCDFRFVRDYKTPRGWPPENLEEHRQRRSEL